MKPFPAAMALVSFLAFGCLDASGQTANDSPVAKPISEQAAVDRFKADLAEISKWRLKRAAENKNDAALGAILGMELIAKVKAVNSDGLPTDLKSAWVEFIAKVSKFERVVKELGGNPADIVEKKAANPYKFEQLKQELNGVALEVIGSSGALNSVALKHGITNIAEITPL